MNKQPKQKMRLIRVQIVPEVAEALDEYATTYPSYTQFLNAILKDYVVTKELKQEFAKLNIQQ